MSGAGRKPSWIIYANCQAGPIASLFACLDSLSREVYSKYIFIHALEEPGQGWDTFPADYMDDVTLVFEQVSEAFPAVRTEFHRRLPSGVRRIRFPALTAHAIWPFAGPDPRAAKGNPYLYGDNIAARLGMRIAGHAVTDDEVFERYMELSQARMPDLERLLEIETAAWCKRDLDSDIPVAPWVTERFRTDQLFLERGCITQMPLQFLAVELLKAGLQIEGIRDAESLKEAQQVLRHYRGRDDISQPVHPLVAERLKLHWFDPHARYRWFMHDLTFREWVVRCVRLQTYVSTTF
jgi:hypothetical protein